jgi:hypothetical protein
MVLRHGHAARATPALDAEADADRGGIVRGGTIE